MLRMLAPRFNRASANQALPLLPAIAKAVMLDAALAAGLGTSSESTDFSQSSSKNLLQVVGYATMSPIVVGDDVQWHGQLREIAHTIFCVIPIPIDGPGMEILVARREISDEVRNLLELSRLI